ncbi:MAG: arginine--tRNA ligase [Candidatus Colwellbacteria bacterium CG10_big_fil_rev_8_21_14_0_10_42_22]|uniref:Arginine--tRNA ligase n=1 Tax=Candidatus Colwellbacteria bacterium CG10_big_fil_rev_8_21_14_0_10_42_22 TaxID=1974540 RepID=A0A2H0VFN9_9BACT|nr:MAG: arginine--tRNA ligase [Candidatus Colwellbacteria bacterium CG10_big_fil_rev_8_21_14_0_10_42_22]
MIKILTEIIKRQLGDSDFDVRISENPERGHLSTNAAFVLAKEKKSSPMKIAEEVRSHLRKHAPTDFFEKIEIVEPGFVNIWLTDSAIKKEFRKIVTSKKWGKEGKKKETIIVEYSAPNIAKPMHVGHLRSTIIGDAVANTLEFLGYQAVRWNYIGDWGTQFGKLIVAYKLWGDKTKIKEDPLRAFGELYVKFHEEVKTHPELDKDGQEEFLKLEKGNKENRKLWIWFKKASLKEFAKVYDKLGVRFNTQIGESFFEKELDATIDLMVKAGIAKESEGALIVDLDDFGLPPAMARKSDGGTLYFTRDIANIHYRIKEYKPSEILYVVANEQTLHFSQIFATAQLLGFTGEEKGVKPIHVKFGLVLGEEGKKFSSREGRGIGLDEMLGASTDLAQKILEARKTGLKKKELKEVVKAVGLGAVKYNDLSQNRMSDIVFNWEKMLSFEGNSAPYLQYTYARLKSILRKAKRIPKLDTSILGESPDTAIVIKLAEFPSVLTRVKESYMPHYLANYLYELAKEINSFYQNEPVLSASSKLRGVRLNLVKASAETLKTGLTLLGIEAVERM